MTSQREPHFGDNDNIQPESMHRSTVVHAHGPRRPRGRGLGNSLLILVLLAATGGSAYFAYTQYQERGRLEAALAAARQTSRIETLEARGTAEQVKKLNTQLRNTQNARRQARKKVSALTASLRKSEARVAELEKAVGAASKAAKLAKAEREKARAAKLGAEKNLAKADSAGDAKIRALQAALKAAEQKAKEQAGELARLGKAHEEAVAARAAAEEKARAALKRAEKSIESAKAAKATEAAKAARAARAAKAAKAAKMAKAAAAAEAAKASQAAAALEESGRLTAEGEIRAAAPRRTRQASGFDSVLKAVEEMKQTTGD